jgi:hypothetical protein
MKILERMVDLRLRKLIDLEVVKVSVEQGGFTTHRSTYDSIFLLQSLQDGAKKHKEPLYAAFLDVKKAFDSVSHRKLLRTLANQGVPDAWVGLVHHLLSDRCTFLGDMEVPIERGTPQGSPLSPLLFILFMEPLIDRLRAGSVGVKLTDAELIRCLLFADDICLVASSLEDLQRMLDICSQWAAEVQMVFNTKKSHLVHLSGPAPDANVALTLSSAPLTWTVEVVYLGVPLRRTRSPSHKLPLEVSRAWASLYRAGAAFNPVVPVPLALQLKLIVSDVLAGVMYPAAVHDLDYTRIDTFVTSLLRRLTGCEAGSSATLLQCETGIVPSKFLAHRRAVQYWLHVSHDAWFAPLLPEFRGQGPRQRLQNIASLYGLHKTTERGTSAAYTLAFLGNRDTTGIDREADFPFSKERWHRKVHDAVEDAAARHLQTKAAERQLPGPETVTKRNGLLKLLPRLYIREGGELAKYGVVFRQCALSGRFQPWDNRHEQPCPHCHSPYKFGDPCHLLVCAGAPPAFAAARSAALGRVAALEARGGPVKLLCNLLVGESTQVPALRSVSPVGASPPWVLGVVRTLAVGLSTRDCLVLVKKAFKLAKVVPD